MNPARPALLPERVCTEALPRRDFMGLTLAAPAAAAASLIGWPLAAPAVAPRDVTAAPKVEPRGYRPSEHTDTYYASLRY